MTRIQELRHRVVLLKRWIKEEEDGSFTECWQEGDSVWANIVPCDVREMAKETGEGWNRVLPVSLKYKVTMRFHRQRFGRVKASFQEGEEIILALLCPPVMDSHRQWMTCLMYELGENNE